MFGSADSVPEDSAAQAAEETSGAVTPEAPTGTPEQAAGTPAAPNLTDAIASYLATNGYVPERVVQSRIDKAVSAAVRRVSGSPDERLSALAAKHGIPEDKRAAFIEETKRAELLAQDAADDGAPQQPAQQGPTADDIQAQWGPVMYEAGLREGDPELAMLNPSRFKGPAEYSRAIVQAGQKAQARRASTATKPAPAAAAAVFPKGGGGNKTSERPTAESARKAFYGG